MEKTGAAQATRSGQESSVMLSSTQIGLAVGVVGVCCLMAFGGGVIAGMWYKASEQGTPYAAFSTSSEDTAPVVSPKTEEPPADPPVTFYDTLKGRTKYAPMNAAPGSAGTEKTPSATGAGAAPGTSAKTTVASVPGGTADTVKTSLPAFTAGNNGSTRTGVVPQQSAPGEQNKSTSAAASSANQSAKTATAAPASGASSAVKPAVAPAATKATATPVKPAIALAPPPSGASALKPAVAAPGTNTSVALAKDTSSATASRVAAATAGGKENRSDADSNARRQTEVQPATTAAAARSGDGQYSVQAGSFRSPEQAERLRSQLAQKGYQARVQLFTTPNNESWYRVRVGNYNDRSAAGQTAQNLTSREQLQTVVANDQR